MSDAPRTNHARSYDPVFDGCQRYPQLIERQTQARLDCAKRNAEPSGDFGMRETFEIGQLDDGGLVLR
jgi:hypothetical protein